MTFKQTLQSILLGGAALFGGYQLLGPNTQYDKLTAKHLWCEKEGTTLDDHVPLVDRRIWPRDLESLKEDQLDWEFANVRNGQSLRYGNIELKVTDSRRQAAGYGPNQAGALTDEYHRIFLHCPGYIKFDVYHDDAVVPGGKGIEIAYASKIWGSGGMFDGWPDFSLQDVLEETDLGSAEIEQILRETLEEELQGRDERERQEYVSRWEGLRQKYQKKIDADPRLKARIALCQRQFILEKNPVSGREGFTYTVIKGDSKVVISRRFAACNEDRAFFPQLYEVDTVHGNNISLSPNQFAPAGQGDSAWRESEERIYPGEKVIVVPTLKCNLADPNARVYIADGKRYCPR